MICLQITLWAHGNVRPRAEGGRGGRAPNSSLMADVELVGAQESVIAVKMISLRS